MMEHLVKKEDVINLFNELLPWEKEEVLAVLGPNLEELDLSEIIEHFGIVPIDFVTASECAGVFGKEILEEFDIYEIFDELDSRIHSIDPCYLIDTLDKKLDSSVKTHWFTEEDAEGLEKLAEKIREKLNKQD